MIGSVLLVSSDRALAEETVLSSGVADASGAQGPGWPRVDFTVPQTGPSTLRLSWTGTADLRFTVFNSATGQKLGENRTAANPKSVTLNLQADPYQLVNLLADGVPANDPDTAPLSQALRAARQCAGTSCP
jgi:hypothetical protein